MGWKPEYAEARRAYDRKWWASASNEDRARMVRQKTDRRKRIAAEVQKYKKTLKCERCEENHPACLDFHHMDGNKEVSVADGVTKGWSFKKIMVEIEKCSVLCSNCHRKEHYRAKLV